MIIEQLYQLYTKHLKISTDTRKLSEGSIFFALSGPNFNANEFAESAIEKGAAYAVISDEKYKKDDRYIVVKNTLQTLQELSNFHRKHLSMPIIGITGSNGKTTTKELMYAVLSQHYKTYATKGNLNNHIGVPLSVLEVNKEHEIAIIEMGANKPGDIKELSEIAEPNFGVITNIGMAHIEGFGSLEGVISTKTELYRFLEKSGVVFLNDTLKHLKEKAVNNKLEIYNTSILEISNIQTSPFISFDYKREKVSTKLYGGYNLDNILTAIAIGEYFKVPQEKIIKGLENYVSENNRSQVITTKTNTIYLDAYNANPSSMEAAIKNFAEVNTKNKLMILGDMLELGNISNQEHQKIVSLATELNITTYFVGNQFKNCENSTQKFFSTTNNLKEEKILSNLNGFHILIKGSRGIKLEDIVEDIP
mgnify:CR=1 FL=1